MFTRLDYMTAHHHGAGKLPQRKVIPEEKQVIRPVLKAASWHLKQAVRKSGL